MKSYSKLTKDEKEKIKKDFLASSDSVAYKKANKIIILSVIGIIIACFSSAFDYIYKTGTVNYVLDGLLFIFSVVFLIKMISFRKNALNNYIFNKKIAN